MQQNERWYQGILIAQELFKALMYLAAAVVCVLLSWAVVSYQRGVAPHISGASAALERSSQHLDSLSNNLGVAIVGSKDRSYQDGLAFQLDKTLRRTNTLIQELSSTTNIVRGTSIDERKNLSKITADVDLLIVDFSGTAQAATGTVTSLTELLNSMHDATLPKVNTAIDNLSAATNHVSDQTTALVTSVKPVLDSAVITVNSLNTLLADENWHKTLFNVQRSTDYAQHSLGEIDHGIHNFFNPTKRGFWSGTLKQLIPRPTFVF